jgi:hypothetical protein
MLDFKDDLYSFDRLSFILETGESRSVSKDLARKYANPETFKTLEQGIFAPKKEQKQEQTIKRR